MTDIGLVFKHFFILLTATVFGLACAAFVFRFWRKSEIPFGSFLLSTTQIRNLARHRRAEADPIDRLLALVMVSAALLGIAMMVLHYW